MPKKQPASSPKDYVERFKNSEQPKSLMTENDIILAGTTFETPEGYTIRSAGEEEFPNLDHSPNDLCIYHDQIKLGLTFSLLNILGNVLTYTQFNLAMLTPNFIGLMVNLYKMCQKYNIAWVPENLFYLFTLKPALCHVAFRARHRHFTTYGYESAIHEWKYKYFFIHSPNGWPFLTSPGNASDQPFRMPPCPAALEQWFDEFPMKIYTLDFRFGDVMAEVEGQKLKGKKVKRNERGEREEKVPLSKKVKLGRITKGQVRKKFSAPRHALRISSPEEDSTPGRPYTSSGSSTSGSYSADLDADLDVGVEDFPISNTPPHFASKEPTAGQTSEPIPPSDGTKATADEPHYFVNESDQLVIKRNADVPLAAHPFNKFSPIVGEFLQSTTESKNFTTLSLEDLDMLYHSYSISAMRAGGHLMRLVKDYHGTLSSVGPEYSKLVTVCENSGKKITELEGQVRSLTEDLKNYDEVIAATAEKDKSLEAENAELKASLARLQAENNEQKKQIESMASSSQELSVGEQLERLSGTKEHAQWMVDLLSQGFEKFRRAAVRRFEDPKALAIIEGIDIVTADQEEDISDSDDDDDSTAPPPE